MPPPSKRPSSIVKPRLLIGEGQDEVMFFDALLSALNIDDIQVEQIGGKDYLPLYLKELPRRPGVGRLVALGVIRDADNDCAGAFAKICGALSANGFGFPPAPGQISASLPQVGVFIMPDNQRSGMLEDLCLDSVATDLALPCVDEFFRCVENAAGRKPDNFAKARVQAWLASQQETDSRLGVGAQKKYWPWDASAFQLLIRFLQALWGHFGGAGAVSQKPANGQRFQKCESSVGDTPRRALQGRDAERRDVRSHAERGNER